MATTYEDRFGNATPSGSVITSPLVGTSTSSASVSTGEKTFSVQQGRAWKPGTRLRISSSGVGLIMEGNVTSYAGASAVTVDVDLLVAGSACSTDLWNLGVAGTRGETGPQGPQGSSAPDSRSMATQDSSSVAITGGAISGLTSLSFSSDGAASGKPSLYSTSTGSISVESTSLLPSADNTLVLGSSDRRAKGVFLGSGAVALGDYQEGTFTPTILADSSGGTPTYAQQQGDYTKIGRVVVGSIRLQLSAWTGSSGFVLLGGLPFDIGADNYSISLSFWAGVKTTDNLPGHNAIGFRGVTGFPQYQLWSMGPTTQATAAQVPTSAVVPSQFNIVGTFIYRTS